jgi:galactitol-specific phosphotransferase system IIC component
MSNRDTGGRAPSIDETEAMQEKFELSGSAIAIGVVLGVVIGLVINSVIAGIGIGIAMIMAMSISKARPRK